jgi:multicomponent Na+:H+ antiporter subunit D
MSLVLPIVIPLAAAATLLLTPARPLVQRWIAFTASILQLAAGLALFAEVNRDGYVVQQIGDWAAPFGITLVADTLSSILVVAVGVVGVAVGVSSFAGVDPRREAYGYHPLIQVLLMGVAGAFLTGDLLNMYVWFEVMLVASFVLMALHRTNDQVAGAFKYVTINLLSSSVFLTALGLLYGSAGTLNMADLAAIWPTRDQPVLDLVIAMLLLMAFGIKAALFPLFFWLPASYPTPPAPIGALFAGLLTKVGVYALIRVFSLLSHDSGSLPLTVLLWLSVATMIVGLLGALAERDFRRVLAFNLVGHIGYTTVGLSLGTVAALAGSLVYVVHHILVITCLFFVAGLLLQLRRTTDLGRLGSLYRDHPGAAVLSMIPLFSLAGLPPLSGFIGKLAVVQGTFGAGAWIAGGAVLIVSLLTIVSMARLWDEAFWKPATEPPVAGRPAPLLLAPIAMLGVLIVGITLGADPIFRTTTRAAEQLLNPAGYVAAVLDSGIGRGDD